MLKKKICFIAQFPPPMHGLSKAVETLYNSNLAQEFEFKRIDITNNKNIIKNLIAIWKSDVDLFYFTISQTKGGNLRDLFILKLIQLKKKRCLVHLHGGDYRRLIDFDVNWWQRNQNYKAIRGLRGTIVLSQSLRNIFKGMLQENNIYVVPNCVDRQYLMEDNEFEEKVKNIKENKILNVLYLSNFIRSKGYREVLELAKLEKERCTKEGGDNKLHFDFAGSFFDNIEKEYFDEFVKLNELSEYITYHGVVNGERKRELLKNSELFILLTRYTKEGQPISILEAMGNGMLIITTDHAGIPEMVRNEVNGFVFNEESDVKKVFEKILSIKYEELIKVVKVNRNVVLDNFSEEKYIENLRTIFNEI